MSEFEGRTDVTWTRRFGGNWRRFGIQRGLTRTFPRQRARQPDVMVSGNLPPPALLGAHHHEQGAKESAV